MIHRHRRRHPPTAKVPRVIAAAARKGCHQREKVDAALRVQDLAAASVTKKFFALRTRFDLTEARCRLKIDVATAEQALRLDTCRGAVIQGHEISADSQRHERFSTLGVQANIAHSADLYAGHADFSANIDAFGAVEACTEFYGPGRCFCAIGAIADREPHKDGGDAKHGCADNCFKC